VAAFGTAAAGLGTALHRRIITKAGAVVGTARTRFGTYSADLGMEFGSPEHKVGARCADLRTIEQAADVAGLGVVPALLEAVIGGSDTHTVAVQAMLNTLFHRGLIVMTLHRASHHGSVPFGR
jgi:hypothetical protein